MSELCEESKYTEQFNMKIPRNLVSGSLKTFWELFLIQSV